MTTIAWDGHTLATDSQETRNGQKFLDAEKLVRIPGGFIATAGRADDGEMFIAWMAEGGSPEEKPQLSEDAKTGFVAVFLSEEDGCLYEYFDTLVPLKVTGVRGWGSGDETAVAAMGLGLTAKEAVKYCTKHDVYTGGKVQHVSVSKERKKKTRGK